MNQKLFELWLAANAMLATKNVLKGDPSAQEWQRLENAVNATGGDVTEWMRKPIQPES